MAVAICCRDLHKTYPGRPPVEAVRGISLEIQQGECFGFLGPNGAGKTTTIEVLEGLLRPTSGHVEVLGQCWDVGAHMLRQRIGISLQETRLSEKLSVEETLRLFRSFYPRGLEPQQVMARVDLQEKARAWVRTLSGGQKQRLALGCALVGDPEVLFLDEPTTGLDPQSRRQLWSMISDLRRQGRTALLTTHYMEEAERLCDRVAIVDRGHVIASGTPQELIAGLGGQHMIEFSLESGAATPDAASMLPAETFQDLASVQSASAEDGRYRLSVSQPHIALPSLLARLASSGRTLAGLAIRHASLDDVFVELAGRHLEDDQTQAPS